MLWMTITTWEPAQRNEILERAQKIGRTTPEGVELLGHWVDLTGGRTFALEDWPPVDDPRVILEANVPWIDLVKIEWVPVMEWEERKKLLPKT